MSASPENTSEQMNATITTYNLFISVLYNFYVRFCSGNEKKENEQETKTLLFEEYESTQITEGEDISRIITKYEIYTYFLKEVMIPRARNEISKKIDNSRHSKNLDYKIHQTVTKLNIIEKQLENKIFFNLTTQEKSKIISDLSDIIQEDYQTYSEFLEAEDKYLSEQNNQRNLKYVILGLLATVSSQIATADKANFPHDYVRYAAQLIFMIIIFVAVRTIYDDHGKTAVTEFFKRIFCVYALKSFFERVQSKIILPPIAILGALILFSHYVKSVVECPVCI